MTYVINNIYIYTHTELKNFFCIISVLTCNHVKRSFNHTKEAPVDVEGSNKAGSKYFLPLTPCAL